MEGARSEGTDIELEAINPTLPCRLRVLAAREGTEGGIRDSVKSSSGASGGNGDKESSETNIKSRNRCDPASQSVFESRDLIGEKDPPGILRSSDPS